jgi:PAS domain S-box-containing protein
MGAAISAMHYTGMAAASFSPSVIPRDLSHSVSISCVGTLGIGAVALMLLALAVFMCLVRRQLAAQAAELEQRVTERTIQLIPVNEELTESEERFRKLVEALPDSILVHSDNKIVFLNPSCLRLLGAQRPEQFLGKDVFEIIHPNYRQAIKSGIQNNYQTGTASPPMESALLTIGGSAIPIEAAAIPITWKGRPAIEVIARDIRQRKRKEETLREYEKVVEGLEEMICVVDREYRYVLANRAFLHYRGMERDQVVGYLVSELLTPSVFGVVKEKLDECFRGKIVSYELRYDYPHLGPRDLFISYYPIEAPEGIDRAACILRDVTERNQAERAAREWQKRLELAEKAGLRIGLWDWDLNANTVIWSDETHRQWGYARETFSGRVEDAVTRIHPEDRCRVEEAIRRALAGDSEYAAQYRVVHPYGNTCWIDAHGVAVREGPTHMLGISIDITDLKKTEQSLQSAKTELGRVNRILTTGELTASIAHEINQPLAAVVTNGSASLRWLAMQPPNLEEAREAMAESIREAKRSSQVIARIRALLNKEPPQMRPLTLNAIIREVLALSATDLMRGGVTEHTELASDLPEVAGDPIQLQQVMLNLIMNGIDAMREVTDRPRELFIKSAKHPAGVLVQVQDSGVGFDSDQADRIFEPFFTTKPKGIGMGLSISRSIIEAHGGRLWAAPGPVQGAVFQFNLPKADTPDERAA